MEAEKWRPSEASAVEPRTGAKRLRKFGTPGAIVAHGANTVIGGRLPFLPGVEVVGLPEALMMPKASALPDSEGKTVAALRADFNALLGELRSAERHGLHFQYRLFHRAILPLIANTHIKRSFTKQ